MNLMFIFSQLISDIKRGEGKRRHVVKDTEK